MAARIAPSGHRPLLGLALTFWAITVVAGFAALARYQTTPGRAAKPPRFVSQRPDHSTRARLLLFLHPECPCSAATVSELDRLMSREKGRLECAAYVYSPRSMPRTWAKGQLYDGLRAIPGVEVSLDQDGKEARDYGASTSGQVLLYAADGRLAFSGGITASRGHEGDNAGSDAILAYLDRGTISISSTPVFGCALRSPGSLR